MELAPGQTPRWAIGEKAKRHRFKLVSEIERYAAAIGKDLQIGHFQN